MYILNKDLLNLKDIYLTELKINSSDLSKGNIILYKNSKGIGTIGIVVYSGLEGNKLVVGAMFEYPEQPKPTYKKIMHFFKDEQPSQLNRVFTPQISRPKRVFDMQIGDVYVDPYNRKLGDDFVVIDKKYNPSGLEMKLVKIKRLEMIKGSQVIMKKDPIGDNFEINV